MKTLLTLLSFYFMAITLAAQPSNSTLQLKLETGKTYHLKNSTKQTIQQSVNGQQFNMEVNSNTDMCFKAINKEKEIWSLEIQFDTIQSKISSPMFNKETNSAKPAKSNEYMERVMNKFSAAKFIVKVSVSGKFLGFTNYKTIRANILDFIDSVPATQKTQVQNQAESFLKEPNVQSLVESYFAYLPEKEVKIGDKWETSYLQASDKLNVMLFNTFTLNAFEGNLAKLSGSTVIESMPSNDPPKNGAPQMTTEAKGTSNSELTLETSTGLISKGSIKSHIEGTVTIQQPNNEMKVSFIADSQSNIN